MTELDRIKSVFHDYSQNEVVNSVLDLGHYYVVSLTRPGLPDSVSIVDGLYALDKEGKKPREFCVNDDRAAYLKALQKPIYVRKP